MTIAKYYRNSSLYPAIIAIAITFIFSLIENKDYKSEWLTAEAVIEMNFITSVIYTLILSVSCLPILLVKSKVISENKILTILCWFLLPVACIATTFTHEIIFKLTHNEKFGKDFLYVILLNLPFIIGLLWTYLNYQKYIYTKAN